jgi:hypothetical protein
MVMLNSSAFLSSLFMSSQPALQGRTQAFGSKPGFPTGVPGDNLFARLLAGKDPGSGSASPNPFKQGVSKGNGLSVSAARSSVTDDDAPVAAVLESTFLAHGVFPDTMVLSREDFDFLGNILEGMGFSRAERTSLFQSMKETRSDGQITLALFLKDLAAFEQTEIQAPGSAFLLTGALDKSNSFDKSAVPHIELILRDLGIPADKMDTLLAAASQDNGAIDIEKLVVQLKSHVAAIGKSAGAPPTSDAVPPQTSSLNQGSDSLTRGTTIEASHQWPGAGAPEALKPSKGLQSDSQTFQQMASGLEKLGLTVSKKGSHLPFTLESFIQALEKKVQNTTTVSKQITFDPVRMAEAVVEMPAMKSMKMEKAATYFGFAKEMIIDKQNKSSGKKSPMQTAESANVVSLKKDDGISIHQPADHRISKNGVQGNKAFHQSDASHRSFQATGLDQNFGKKITDPKAEIKSQAMLKDVPKPDMEKGAAVYKTSVDPLSMPVDIAKTDGIGGPEIHQNLIPGGEKFQSMGVSYTGASENLSSPVKQTAAFQQGPLPAAVVNQVGREIAAFVRRGDRFFTLQLKPPELGIVNIEMDVKENALKMSVVTETSSAKDLLHANYVDLKRVLEGYGIRVEAFDVQLNDSLNHASANGDGSMNQQHSQTGMGKNFHFGKSSGETAEENNVEPPVPPGKNSEALLDLLA